MKLYKTVITLFVASGLTIALTPISTLAAPKPTAPSPKAMGKPTAEQKDPFPGRRIYPHVKAMELGVLKQRFDEVVVVDARTSYEYETIHIKGAENVTVSKRDFEEKIKALYEKVKPKPLVFYCNGHTCMKSYKAATRAQRAGIENVYAFDAGIFDWTKAHPDKAVLLGKSPVNVADLIPKKVFKKRLLEPVEFEKRVATGKYLIVDVRSRLQRAGAGVFALDGEKFASLSDKQRIDWVINLAKKSGKPMLIYDEVGKQVRWLEYYLRRKGIRDYAFMKGGSDSYFKYLAKKQNSSLILAKDAKKLQKDK